LIPFPNIIAGVLTGLANSSWVEVLTAAGVFWPIVYSISVALAERPRALSTIATLRERGRHLLFGSPLLTFYAIEAITASVTALIVASATFGIKTLLG